MGGKLKHGKMVLGDFAVPGKDSVQQEIKIEQNVNIQSKDLLI
jgi:hypothetical protein